MNVLLYQLNVDPLVYGVIMFFGLWIMMIKLARGAWTSVAMDVLVFWLVFKLHGGTMSGGFSAMIAALLAGLVFPATWKILRRF